MTINDKKREYIDKEIFNILDLFEESESDVFEKPKSQEIGPLGVIFVNSLILYV
jgi:hypothetical protein